MFDTNPVTFQPVFDTAHFNELRTLAGWPLLDVEGAY